MTFNMAQTSKDNGAFSEHGISKDDHDGQFGVLPVLLMTFCCGLSDRPGL